MMISKQIQISYKSIIITGLLLFISLIYSCTENPTEQKDEPCPPIDLVSNPPYDSPVWHPSGDFIGFNHTPLDSITYPYGKHCIGNQHFNYDSTGFWLINIDGTNMQRILPFKLQTPAWSPDGKWIAFVLPDYQIYKMPFDIDKRSFDTTKIVQLTFEGRNFFPAWSPDGQWIAFDSNYDSPDGGYKIWRMKIDGTNKSLVVGGRMPCWSENQRWIFYIGLHNEVYKVNVSNSTDVSRLTHLNEKDIYATDNRYPKYSPDGTLIAYTSQPKGGLPQLWLLDLANNENRKLTTKGTVNIFSWSPDGNRIVYTHHNYNDWSYNNGVLWIIDIKTKNEFQLTFNKKGGD